MSPFEIIMSLMAYIALGHFLLKSDESTAPSDIYAFAILIWPLVFVIAMFLPDDGK